MLLTAHAQRGHVVQAVGGVDRLPQSPPPLIGMDLGSVGMSRSGLADERAVGGVADDDLAGLRRGIDASDQGHAEFLPR